MPKCSVRGCHNPVRTRSLCNAHHLRLLRHGDTDYRKIPNGTALAFLDAATQHVGEKCLPWPYTKTNGYGCIGLDGRKRRVSNVICERTYGPAPGLDAAHSCGNRACINWRHLSWKTRSENEFDKVAHGTSKRGQGKLTAKEVIRIRKSALSSYDIAAKLGVSASAIRAIRQGRNWSWL